MGFEILSIAFIFGVIIGSFLNVVIYRLHTGRSINGDSHCLSCGHYLSWYELVPLISYIMLGGKCRVCKSRIPARYFLVELMTALFFVLVAMTSETLFAFVFGFMLVSVLVVIAVYDVYHLIIPDEAVLSIGALALLSLGFFWYETHDSSVVSLNLMAGGIAFLFFAALWKYSKGRWLGFGDAKLALPLGVLVGLGGVFSLIVFSFWIGAVISGVVMGLQWVIKRGQFDLRFLGRPLTIKSEVPFAPFLLLSFILVYFFDADVLNLMTLFV